MTHTETTLTTQAQRDERIRALTAGTTWEPRDYKEFAADPVEKQLTMIARWTEKVRLRNAPPAPAPVAQPVEMVRCSCGHTVPRIQMMSASLGTACPSCYDRMS